MDPLQTIVLALVQGLTEILPISSSGHLILVPWVFGWADQGLAFDVAVHVGTLVAIVGYFRADVVRYWNAWWRSLARRALDQDGRLAWGLVIGTIPAAVAGLLFKHEVETVLRTPQVIAFTTIGYALLLLAADLLGHTISITVDSAPVVTTTVPVEVSSVVACQVVPTIPTDTTAGTSRSSRTSHPSWVRFRRRNADMVALLEGSLFEASMCRPLRKQVFRLPRDLSIFRVIPLTPRRDHDGCVSPECTARTVFTENPCTTEPLRKSGDPFRSWAADRDRRFGRSPGSVAATFLPLTLCVPSGLHNPSAIIPTPSSSPSRVLQRSALSFHSSAELPRPRVVNRTTRAIRSSAGRRLSSFLSKMPDTPYELDF